MRLRDHGLEVNRRTIAVGLHLAGTPSAASRPSTTVAVIALGVTPLAVSRPRAFAVGMGLAAALLGHVEVDLGLTLVKPHSRAILLVVMVTLATTVVMVGLPSVITPEGNGAMEGILLVSIPVGNGACKLGVGTGALLVVMVTLAIAVVVTVGLLLVDTPVGMAVCEGIMLVAWILMAMAMAMTSCLAMPTASMHRRIMSTRRSSLRAWAWTTRTSCVLVAVTPCRTTTWSTVRAIAPVVGAEARHTQAA